MPGHLHLNISSHRFSLYSFSYCSILLPFKTFLPLSSIFMFNFLFILSFYCLKNIWIFNFNCNFIDFDHLKSTLQLLLFFCLCFLQIIDFIGSFNEAQLFWFSKNISYLRCLFNSCIDFVFIFTIRII